MCCTGRPTYNVEHKSLENGQVRCVKQVRPFEGPLQLDSKSFTVSRILGTIGAGELTFSKFVFWTPETPPGILPLTL